MVSQKKYDTLKAMLIAQRKKSLTQGLLYKDEVDEIISMLFGPKTLKSIQYKKHKTNLYNQVESFMRIYSDIFVDDSVIPLFTVSASQSKEHRALYDALLNIPRYKQIDELFSQLQPAQSVEYWQNHEAPK